MTIDFLLKYTFVADTPAYTTLFRTPLYSIKYLIELFVRKHLCKQHVKRIIKDLANYADLKSVFVDSLNMSISDDELFCYIECDVPEEVREQTEHLQLMSYAESTFVEQVRPLQKDSDFNTLYLLNTFVTMSLVKSNKMPFAIFDNENFVKFIALYNNRYKIIAYSILQLIILTNLILYIYVKN